MARPKPHAKPTRAGEPDPTARSCGLCGATGRLTRTECCGNWICDDEDQYQLFFYARNSCFRNHRRYTLCGYHHAERHSGPWQDGATWREEQEPELYVALGTNDYNFEKLDSPPTFVPTHSARWMQSGKKRCCENGTDAVR